MMIPLKFVGYPILIPWHDGDRSHGPHGITMGSARLSPFDHGMELETQLLGDRKGSLLQRIGNSRNSLLFSRQAGLAQCLCGFPLLKKIRC
ncbi:MAG: hypothetical protein DMG62_15435 [Acidobacteria bacterium]|nr:MAG: hypothetical protein DMG62_15435 [Acidobacteriota bacterium]